MLRAAADHFSHSDTGRQRRANEDAYFARSPVFVVADGMGGAQAGEVASSTAVQTFEQGLDEAAGSSAEERLAARIQEANGRIHDMAQEDEQRAGMGTTITAAHVGEHDVAVAHVGDSRAYRLRGEDFERLTEDHSLVEEMRRRGQLTAQEADEHPQRSIITRALGPEAEVLVDTASFRGEAGDVFLLCSDGLTSMLPEAEVGEIVSGAVSLQAAGRALIDAANAAGGRDNITVILFRLEEVGAGGAVEAPTTVGMMQARDVEAALAEQESPATVPHAAPPPDVAPPAESQPGMPTPAGPAPPAEQPEERLPDQVVRRLQPREPKVGGDGSVEKRRGRMRKLATVFVVLAIFFVPLGIGGYLASQAVYFVGTDEDGFVTMYKGVPYELPFGLDLYTQNYVTGVPAASLDPKVRQRLLNHKLRSREDAGDYLRRLERGEIAL